MTPFIRSLLVWAGWLAAFLVLELLAVFDVAPWNTLSWTVWQLEARYAIAALLVAGGLFALILHLVLPRARAGGHWPVRQQDRDYTEGKR